MHLLLTLLAPVEVSEDNLLLEDGGQLKTEDTRNILLESSKHEG